MNHLNLLPCPVLVTDHDGQVLNVNKSLLELVGGSEERWMQRPMEDMFPLAGRIFLQTFIWPMLLVEGRVDEIKLQILDKQHDPVPVLVNCQKAQLVEVE